MEGRYKNKINSNLINKTQHQQASFLIYIFVYLLDEGYVSKIATSPLCQQNLTLYSIFHAHCIKANSLVYIKANSLVYFCFNFLGTIKLNHKKIIFLLFLSFFSGPHPFLNLHFYLSPQFYFISPLEKIIGSAEQI